MVKNGEIILRPFSRGFHIITHEIDEFLTSAGIENGFCHAFILHTSASLTVNENADPTVRQDFEAFFNRAVPENEPYFRHTLEGSDDMPAHIKASLLGHSVTLPVAGGRLKLGTWQGIYLGEHRDRGGSRRIFITVMGE